MIRKSISLALCFSTVLSSISWSMESDAPNGPKTLVPSSTLTLLPLTAFAVSNSSTQTALQRNPQTETALTFVRGAQDGFSAYAQESWRVASRILRGEFSSFSQDAINTMVRSQLETSLRQYQRTSDVTRSAGDIDFHTLQNVFTLVREGVYQSLLRTGAFGNSRRIFVPERGVTETHYDVTLGMAATFVGAILPEATPFRSALLSLINNSKINTFLLRQIDSLFAQLTLQYFEQLTGQKITQVALKALRFTGLSGVNLALSEYTDAASTPRLSAEINPSFSNLWQYISPRMTYFVRQGLIESVVAISGVTADKISDPAVLTIARAVETHASTINTIATGAGYYVGEALTSIPLLDGAAVGAVSFWASNGLIRAALPRGLDESRRKLIECVMNTLRLTAIYYVNSFLPVTADEHHLYGLNSTPTDLESSLFRADYEQRDRLNRQNIVSVLLQDLASAIRTPLNAVLEASGINSMTVRLLGTGNADGLALTNAPQGHAQANHNDTVARIKLFELAKALQAIDTQQTNFEQTAGWYDRALKYWNGQIPNQLGLTPEQQNLLDLIRAHPSFELRQAELQHLANHYTWLSQNDRATKLEPYEQERHRLSVQFTQDAVSVLQKIEDAKTVLRGKGQDPESMMSTLMNGLGYDHFIMALDAINNADVINQFDFNLPLTDLPAFTIAVTDFTDLLRTHGKLVKLIQTTSLGANLTLRGQLELAQELSVVEDAYAQLSPMILDSCGQTIPQVEAAALYTRYEKYRNNYLATVLYEAFIKAAGESGLRVMASCVDPTNMVLCEKYLGNHSDFKEFETCLNKKNFSDEVKLQSYAFILQKLFELKNEKEPSSLNEQPVSYYEIIMNYFQNPGYTPLSKQDLTDGWVVVGDENKPSDVINFALLFPDLDTLEFKSLVDDGFEAYFVAEMIRNMIKDDPTVFDGRSAFDLRQEDMLKVTKRMDDIRLSKIVSSEDRLFIEQYQGELAKLVEHSAHSNDVIWTYDTLIQELKAKAGKTISDFRKQHMSASQDVASSSGAQVPENSALV